MALIRWLLVALMAFAFVLLAVSNWTMVDFILPDGSARAVPLPLLLGLAFLAGMIPTWVWMGLLRPLAGARKAVPRAERTEVAAPLVAPSHPATQA
jgi:uncharacterized integral membrane protein